MPDKLYIADKATLDAIAALVGTANPAVGDLTTIFRGLKLIADYVDTLETVLGATGDAAAATGTVEARLAELLTNRLTTARGGKLDLVGNTGDAAGTGSLFARLAQIAGYTDGVEAALGTTADAAAAGGTALARLAYLAGKANPPIGTKKTTYSISQTDFQTILNVAGPGVLLYFYVTGSDTSATGEAILNVDGTTIDDISFTGGNYSYYYEVDGGPARFAGGSITNIMLLPFKNSLQIQIKSTHVGSALSGQIYYAN